MGFDYWRVELKFMSSNNLELVIGCDNLIGHLASMTVVCRDLSPILSHVERLDFRGERVPWYPAWVDEIRPPTSLDWLGLFSPFIAVQSLYASRELGRTIAPALEELARERATAVFPELRTLSVEGLRPSGSVRDAVVSFVVMREVSGHPVAFQQWTPMPGSHTLRTADQRGIGFWDPTSDD